MSVKKITDPRRAADEEFQEKLAEYKKNAKIELERRSGFVLSDDGPVPNGQTISPLLAKVQNMEFEREFIDKHTKFTDRKPRFIGLKRMKKELID